MALKRWQTLEWLRAPDLAVPSYGAMALNRHTKPGCRQANQSSCSPLLRGDGPETTSADFDKGKASQSCSPLLRGDGPETPRHAVPCLALHCPCSPLLRGDGPETVRSPQMSLPF